MRFEYDLNKSDTNKYKHGIDFEESQAIWDDEDLVQVDLDTSDEPRFMCTGMFNEKHWTAIFTVRNGDIRIISVRRSRIKEIERYEGI